MTLGEALSLRAKQAQKMNDLVGRIKASALVQEGSEPPENADTLIAEYLQVSLDHAILLSRIAETNVHTMLGAEALIDLLRERERLVRERNIYSMAANAGSSSGQGLRYMRSELKYVPQVDVAALRAKEDQTSEKVRALDARIQEANWKTELI